LIPIIRTQHGLSLIGLKRLGIYRQLFIQAAIDEDRWDFHLFNDRRWVSGMEFPDEPESFLRDYRIFSLATMLSMIIKNDLRGYEIRTEVFPKELLNEPPAPFLGRREAYVFLQEHKLFVHLKTEVDKRISETYGQPGATTPTTSGRRSREYLISVKDHIRKLESKIEKALTQYEEDDRLRPERILKADVSQIHTEIRAMQSELKEQQIGI
jgi:hypothetical protein